jgi:hypothetical protein
VARRVSRQIRLGFDDTPGGNTVGRFANEDMAQQCPR